MKPTMRAGGGRFCGRRFGGAGLVGRGLVGRIAHPTPRGGPGLRRALAGSHVVFFHEDAAAVTVVRGVSGRGCGGVGWAICPPRARVVGVGWVKPTTPRGWLAGMVGCTHPTVPG